MGEQLGLFETEQQRQPDGAIVVRAKRLVDGQEVGLETARKMLGFRTRKAAAKLIGVPGGLVGWKPAAKRGNAKWRIDLGSVIDYKRRRTQAAADGVDEI